MKPRRGWLIWSAAALVVIAVGVGLLVARNGRGDGKKKNEKEGPTAAPVEVAAVRLGDITTSLETTTTLEARNSATLVANRSVDFGLSLKAASDHGRQRLRRTHLIPDEDRIPCQSRVRRRDLCTKSTVNRGANTPINATVISSQPSWL